jgi:succinoglycan biosynthesis transport protein ExoP
MTTQTQHSDTLIPSLNEILRLLWRHKIILVLATLIPFIFSGLYIQSLPNIYSATGSIVIEDSQLKMANFDDVTSGGEFDTLTIQTQAQLLRSPAIALKTIEELGLNTNPKFKAALGGPANMDDKAVGYAVLREFQDNLKVTPFPTSRVIDITFVSRDPALAAEIVNTQIDLYIQSQLDAKMARSKKLNNWIDLQVDTFKTQVSEKSAEIARFRAANGLALGENSEELIYQQISDIAGQLVPVEVKKMDMQARLRGLDSAGGDGIAEVVGSRLIQDLKTRENIARQKVESLRTEYGPNHPKMIAAQSELEEVSQAITTEIAHIRASVISEANAVSRQQSMLNAKLNRMQDEADSIREKMVVLRGMEVEEEASRKLLDDFLARQEEIKAQINFATADTKVISTAAPAARPFAPRKKAMLAAALMASIFFGFAAVFIRTLFDVGLKNFQDVKTLDITPLGILPKVAKDRTYKAILYGGESSYKESVKRIYMNGIMGRNVKSVMVTSAMPKEGKTDFTLSLANYLTSIGQKVLVIDTDFFAPQIHKNAGVTLEPGFADVARGGLSINQAIQTNDDGVAILSAGNPAHYSPANLKAETFTALLNTLAPLYDYILIDTGPMLARAEAGIIASQVDGVVLLSNWMKTPVKAVKKSADLVTSSGGNLCGLVLNKVNIAKYKAYNAESDFLLPKYRGGGAQKRAA